MTTGWKWTIGIGVGLGGLALFVWWLNRSRATAAAAESTGPRSTSHSRTASRPTSEQRLPAFDPSGRPKTDPDYLPDNAPLEFWL